MLLNASHYEYNLPDGLIARVLRWNATAQGGCLLHMRERRPPFNLLQSRSHHFHIFYAEIMAVLIIRARFVVYDRKRAIYNFHEK